MSARQPSVTYRGIGVVAVIAELLKATPGKLMMRGQVIET